MTRQMVMVGFLQAQNCTNLPSSWRHPESRDDSMSADYYQEIARILEAGKFHMAFFDDRLAMPDRYGNDHAHTVEYGIRCVKMDPIVVLTTMGMVTDKARPRLDLLDHLLRAVRRRAPLRDPRPDDRRPRRPGTSSPRSMTAKRSTWARTRISSMICRYDRADEFMEVVLGHWDSWEDGALIIDKKSGRFADPTKVKRLDHKGKFFKSRGPFTVPRSPQGHPVDHPGRRLRPRPALCRPLGRGDLHRRAQSRRAPSRAMTRSRNEAAKAGRDPDQMFLCNLTTPVCGATKAEAEDKMALIEKLPLEIDALSLLAEGLNFDFAAKGIDEPLTTEELQGMQGMLGIRDGVLKNSGKTNPSDARLHHLLRPRPGPGRHRRRAEGDRRQAGRDVRRAAAATALSSRRPIVPGSYADFVKHVVPELQRRGLFHKDYAGKTLRENLGPASARRPAPGKPGRSAAAE